MRRYYYVSLPYYGHRVFKCQGFGAEDPKHLAFYLPYFERYGCKGENDKSAEAEGPYQVLILDHAPGDKVDGNGLPISTADALRLFRAAAR